MNGAVRGEAGPVGVSARANSGVSTKSYRVESPTGALAGGVCGRVRLVWPCQKR
jgi:hypothetical protein